MHVLHVLYKIKKLFNHYRIYRHYLYKLQWVTHSCSLSLMHCGFMLGNTQFMNTFLVCKDRNNLLFDKNMEQLHCLDCDWTDIEIPAHPLANIPTKRTGTYISSMPCMYDVPFLCHIYCSINQFIHYSV